MDASGPLAKTRYWPPKAIGVEPSLCWEGSFRLLYSGESMAQIASETVQHRVVCAWCEKCIRTGAMPISHGICKPCARKQLDDLRDEKRQSKA
jgi:hypothetical protein